MSFASYVSIAFSYDLCHSDGVTKEKAILNLKDYLEARPDIKTGKDIPLSISYAVAPYLSGDIKLSETFRVKVIHAELTETQRIDITRLGFSTRVVGPRAYEFFSNPFASLQEVHP